MSSFGTSERTIVASTPMFGETRYTCDVEKMINGIISTYDTMCAETARRPCALHLHPADYQYLREDKQFATVRIDADVPLYFLSMRVIETPALSKGVAQLSICPGCQHLFGICANGLVWK